MGKITIDIGRNYDRLRGKPIWIDAKTIHHIKWRNTNPCFNQNYAL